MYIEYKILITELSKHGLIFDTKYIAKKVKDKNIINLSCSDL